MSPEEQAFRAFGKLLFVAALIACVGILFIGYLFFSLLAFLFPAAPVILFVLLGFALFLYVIF